MHSNENKYPLDTPTYKLKILKVMKKEQKDRIIRLLFKTLERLSLKIIFEAREKGMSIIWVVESNVRIQWCSFKEQLS